MELVPRQESVAVGRVAEDRTVAENGDGAIFAHDDDGGEGIIVAISPGPTCVEYLGTMLAGPPLPPGVNDNGGGS